MQRLSILFATSIMPNSYNKDLAKSLSNYHDVTFGVDNFWLCMREYDIVHIHWPEELNYWKELSQRTLDRLNTVLEHWSNHAKIVVTMHNERPHNSTNSLNEQLYSIVYSFANAVIHLGSHSLSLFHKNYPDLTPLHRITFLQSYCRENKDMNKQQARKSLNIDENRKVMLVFGSIRNFDEEKLIIESFKACNINNKTLLIANWRGFNSSNNLISKVFFKLYNFYMTKIKKYVLHVGEVEPSSIDQYLCAADILFIPRLVGLNSGVISLGFSYGLVVVGPEIGNMKELLQETGNPTFNPLEPEIVSNAINQGFSLASRCKGAENLKFSNTSLNINEITKQHSSLYLELVRREV
ncbi:hypothetical protein CMT41_18090 [Colwellia sp. MT41]|uniref:glycosyltransferase n=1 Tax=Colwellia sp. MT41 TaxID=58049 RepID=UPI000717845A|nr:hypothetical protein [Colwellia sp. MT41]ALO36440.1 hypothetical protein CMT41_18090 [Colwellia sp. MT41]